MRMLLAILIVTASLAGCAKDEPAAVVVPPPPPRPTPEFTLDEAVLFEGDASDEGVGPRLRVDFGTNVDINITVEALGERVGVVRGVNQTETQVTIPLSWEEIPDHGHEISFDLRVHDAIDGRLAHEGTVSFDGQSLVFAEPPTVTTSAGKITAISGVVQNEGDVPAYVTGFGAEVEGVAFRADQRRDSRLIQPSETYRFTLSGDEVYPPGGTFNVTVNLLTDVGEPGVGVAQITHTVDIVDIRPLTWSARGLDQIEVILQTGGDMASTIDVLWWGFDDAMRRVDTADLRLGDPWVLQPNREHKVILSEGRGAYLHPSRTNLTVEILDGESQAVAKRSVELPAPEFTFLSPTATFSCSNVACRLESVSFYVDSTGDTPVYFSGWRVSVDDQRYVLDGGFEAGATQSVEKLVSLGVSRISGISPGADVEIRIDALARDGTDAYTYTFETTAEEPASA